MQDGANDFVWDPVQVLLTQAKMRAAARANLVSLPAAAAVCARPLFTSLSVLSVGVAALPSRGRRRSCRRCAHLRLIRSLLRGGVAHRIPHRGASRGRRRSCRRCAHLRLTRSLLRGGVALLPPPPPPPPPLLLPAEDRRGGAGSARAAGGDRVVPGGLGRAVAEAAARHVDPRQVADLLRLRGPPYSGPNLFPGTCAAGFCL